MNKRCDLVLPAEHREPQLLWANIQCDLSHRKETKAQKPWWGWLRMPFATIIPNKTHLKHFCIQLLWSFSSVQFSHSVACDSATPCTAALQASLSMSNTNAQSLVKHLSIDWWCHPTISSSVISSSGLQSFPAPGSFQMSQFFASGGQSIGVSVSTSVLSMNIQDWSPLGWAGWISLQSKGLSRVFSNTTVQKHQ